MNPPKAKRQKIAPTFFPQNEIDPAKVARYALAMERGETFPPVVVVRYGDQYMPIDGHHRLMAAQVARLKEVDAYVVGHRAFENYDLYGDERADMAVLCDGIRAMDVADHFATTR